MMSETDWARTLASAREAGKCDGLAAASWFFDGNTSEETYKAVLRGIEDGDPEILDALPWLDLSGQWADGATSSDILSGLVDDPEALDPEEASEIVDAFSEAYDEAVVAEIERMAREPSLIPGAER